MRSHLSHNAIGIRLLRVYLLRSDVQVAGPNIAVYWRRVFDGKLRNRAYQGLIAANEDAIRRWVSRLAGLPSVGSRDHRCPVAPVDIAVAPAFHLPNKLGLCTDAVAHRWRVGRRGIGDIAA